MCLHLNVKPFLGFVLLTGLFRLLFRRPTWQDRHLKILIHTHLASAFHTDVWNTRGAVSVIWIEATVTEVKINLRPRKRNDVRRFFGNDASCGCFPRTARHPYKCLLTGAPGCSVSCPCDYHRLGSPQALQGDEAGPSSCSRLINTLWDANSTNTAFNKNGI